MAVRHISRLIRYQCTLSSIFTSKIGKHIWEIWHYNRKKTKKTVCVLQCGDTQCQDVIPDDWPCAIFVSVKMGFVLWIWNYTTPWNSIQTFRECRKHGRGGQREKNMKMRGLVARYHVRDCLWGEARWWGSKVEQCGDMCTRLQGWQKNNEHSRELQKQATTLPREAEPPQKFSQNKRNNRGCNINCCFNQFLTNMYSKTLMHIMCKNDFVWYFFFHVQKPWP